MHIIIIGYKMEAIVSTFFKDNMYVCPMSLHILVHLKWHSSYMKCSNCKKIDTNILVYFPGDLTVIDYEMIGLNYEGFDLASLFAVCPMWKTLFSRSILTLKNLNFSNPLFWYNFVEAEYLFHDKNHSYFMVYMYGNENEESLN